MHSVGSWMPVILLEEGATAQVTQTSLMLLKLNQYRSLVPEAPSDVKSEGALCRFFI